MQLFLDANVLFTAAHRETGKAAFVVQRAGSAPWEVLTCALAVEEARRNLELKFPAHLRELKSLLARIDIVETIVGASCPLSLPSKDQPILLSALHSRCTHLLTGDRRHFGRFMNRPDETEGLIIQTVADFLDQLSTG